MKDVTKVILAVLGGFAIGAKVQRLISLKHIAILNENLRDSQASENEAIKERNEFAKKADDLRRDNWVLKHCNDAQGMLLIEQQREIKDLRKQLYN